MKITDDMLTEWFPGHKRPIHVGTYEIRSDVINSFFFPAHWDGRSWIGYDSKVPLKRQNRVWRGLKEKHHG